MVADPTICVHLFPSQNDMLLLKVGVRPFGDVGPFHLVAQGAEKLIEPLEVDAEMINHQTKRIFSLELEQLQQVQELCPAMILDAENGQTIEKIESCLELIDQLETCAKETRIKLEWPEGQTMHIKQKISAKNLSLEIRGSSSRWFEYDGEINLDNDEVIKMENLLLLLENSSGRFLPVGDGQYLALTDGFKKRLEELKAISEKNSIFNLGTSTLEALADEAGEVKFRFCLGRSFKKYKIYG